MMVELSGLQIGRLYPPTVFISIGVRVYPRNDYVIENSTDPLGNRVCDLLVCSANASTKCATM